MVKMTLRISEEMHEKLRWLSYKEKKSQQVVTVAILETALKDVEVPEDHE